MYLHEPYELPSFYYFTIIWNVKASFPGSCAWADRKEPGSSVSKARLL